MGVPTAGVQQRPKRTPRPCARGLPRLSLGSWSGDGHTDFHDVVGAILDRRAGILVVASGGDATIRTFGLDGEWRRTRGGTGGGPQEFRELTALFGISGRFPPRLR